MATGRGVADWVSVARGGGVAHRGRVLYGEGEKGTAAPGGLLHRGFIPATAGKFASS